MKRCNLIGAFVLSSDRSKGHTLTADKPRVTNASLQKQRDRDPPDEPPKPLLKDPSVGSGLSDSP